MDTLAETFALVCRVGAARLCALPLAHVVETLRPQVLAPLPGAPAHVLGIALIRGVAQPVVDLAQLLGEPGAHELPPTRYVSLRVGERRMALAVAAVVGLRPLPQHSLQALPPLLRDVQGGVSATSVQGAELLLVLDSAKLLPDPAELEGTSP